MVRINYSKQILFEPNHFYHAGFPFSLNDFDSSIFENGYHFGQFASYKEIEEGLFLAARDPLGIGKLFYTETPEGELHFSDKFVNLFPYGSKIYSVPAGTLVKIGSGGKKELVRNLGVMPEINENLTEAAFKMADNDYIKAFRKRLDDRLNSLFNLFRDLENAGWSFFIALSGGLDSAIIASKAAKYLNSPIACTLDLGKSEDSEKSQKIATYLGLKHLVFSTNKKEIFDSLEKAPTLCQDYRDFNVHCATLNMLVAKNIQQYINSGQNYNKDKVIVLTGDLMNEFTCDYAGEVIDGVEYYRLPRVNKKTLQDILISGLDTSDREISVFNAFGLQCIQPFAILYDLYYSMPESVLKMQDPKRVLNSYLVDDKILEFIPKTKLRAQVGSRENMGILGLCHYKGINNETFHKNLLDKSGYKDRSIPIFAGHYETEVFK